MQFTSGIISIINESSHFLLDEKGRHAKSQCTSILQKICNKDAYFPTEVLSESLCRTDYQIIENTIADELPLSHVLLSDQTSQISSRAILDSFSKLNLKLYIISVWKSNSGKYDHKLSCVHCISDTNPTVTIKYLM